MNFHVVETQIRYLTFDEGGRKTGMYSGYRGQFYYDGEDFDGFQYFPDIGREMPVELGREVRAFVRFNGDRWDEIHRYKLYEGKVFLIREGPKTVGEGIVTRLEVPKPEWNGLCN